MSLSAQLAAALEHYRSGALNDALNIYLDIIRADPECFLAIFNAGLIAYQLGNHEGARELFELGLLQHSDNPQLHNALGVVLLDQGDLAAACSRFECAIEFAPEFSDAHFNLGRALKFLNHDERSEASLLRSSQLDPKRTDALIELSIVLRRQQRVAEAREVLNDGLRRNPNCILTLVNLGALELSRGNLEAAEDASSRALALSPKDVESLTNLGLIRAKQGRIQDAISFYHRAITVNPQAANAHSNLGSLLSEMNLTDAAKIHLEKAVEIQPGHTQARTNLCSLLCSSGSLSAAISVIEDAIKASPESAEAHNNLGQALRDVGRINEAVQEYARATQLAPLDRRFFSNWIVAEQYRPDVSLQRLMNLNEEWNRRFSPNTHARQSVGWKQLAEPSRRLRIGFLSSDLSQHPVGFFSIGVAESLDSERFELLIYNDRRDGDWLTKRFRNAADDYRDVAGVSDQDCRALIMDDNIDVLFDLNGHFHGGRRLPVFSERAAPLQISWAGYAGSTGVGNIDYILTDAIQTPTAEDQYYTESVYRIPDGYVCYTPPAYSPSVSEPPHKKTGFITFGCFNNPAKLNVQIISTWASIMLNVPNSRMLLKYRGMADPANQERIVSAFQQAGIEDFRLELQGRSPHSELLEAYGDVDISLDTSPYSGGLTTCESLWMGVPVVTLPGQTMAGRHTASHLTQVGLNELITTSKNSFAQIAVALARDSRTLTNLRHNLRARMVTTLCDQAGFTRRWEAAVRSMWMEKCCQSP